jgi:nitrogen fixation/metabolism regulation signal transduction histidine kinase
MALAKDRNQLMPFVESIRASLEQDPDKIWSQEITLNRRQGRQVLLCRRSPLVSEDEIHGGQVLVFDDVTTLVKAQRDAAWGEVARRLAHEIKNPLTPVQLSAERLRRKFLDRLPEVDRAILDRATQTIVQQVEAMKTMVNAFSDYAKPSHLEAEPLELDLFAGGVAELYRGATPKVFWQAGAEGAHVEADPVRLRQVLHNLIKNGQEAVASRTGGRVVVSSRLVRDAESPYVEVQVEDNGAGFDDSIIGSVFEPYVTTKAKGTGLGLAIVKKIVEEHGGSITAENAAGSGAVVVVRLPVVGEPGEKAAYGRGLPRRLEGGRL